MDDRLRPAAHLTSFGDRVRDLGVVGLYVGGSLAFGDYRPGVSDLDVIAVIDQDLDRRQRRQVTELHLSIPDTKLHCAYLWRGAAEDLAHEHRYWAHGELYRRTISGIARAEVLRGGITVYGPPPADLIPPVDDATLRAAALGELTGYWSKAVRKPHLWREDVYVDLGLTTLARVQATLTENRLITKREAIERLAAFGVPDDLREEIARRRGGETVALSDRERGSRAKLARDLMIAGIERLT
ncbi:nucleotidyltransferase domain-containing protein [Hamadaea sp. NPDC050747]|uniref:nucleotidyltransferase domain-containing protein n=1 Tax=Hamadaea sp. NPDC050747 TaxID=3155789 RepID=UPI0033C859C9